MVTRAERLGHFITDAEPPFGSLVEVLCEGHVGTNRLPWLCISTPEGPAERAHGNWPMPF